MNKKQIFKLALVLVLAISLVISGCSMGKNKEAAIQKNNQQNSKQGGLGEGQAKDSLVLAVGSEPDGGFDPTTGWGRYGSPLFQSTLLKRDIDLNIVNDLATGYSVSEDAKTWTVKLRDDVQFSDGQPLTAADVVFTYETAANNGSSIDLTNLQSVKAEDENTVLFTLKKPQSTFVFHLASLGIVPQHAYGENYSQNPIGSGPFKFVQWDRGQQLIVEANENYYGEQPSFKKLTFLFITEDVAYAKAKAGEVDITAIPASFSNQQVPGMKMINLKSVDNRGIAFPTVPAQGKNAAGNEVGNDVTADIAIRKAINVAIDRQALVDGILEGHGTPAYSANDGLPWWNEQISVKDGDLAAAKQILADAGWKDSNGDGIVEKGNLKAEFTIIYPSNDVIRQSLSLAVADMVLLAGIRINVDGKSWDDIGKLMHSNAIALGWGSHDPLEMYNLYHSSYGGVDYYNTGYYNNATVDQYLDAAMDATSEQAALEFWKKAQWDGNTGLSALGDAPWAWLVNIDHIYLVNEKLDIGQQKIQPHGHGWPVTDNIAEWKWTN